MVWKLINTTFFLTSFNEQKGLLSVETVQNNIYLPTQTKSKDQTKLNTRTFIESRGSCMQLSLWPHRSGRTKFHNHEHKCNSKAGVLVHHLPPLPSTSVYLPLCWLPSSIYVLTNFWSRSGLSLTLRRYHNYRLFLLTVSSQCLVNRRGELKKPNQLDVVLI